MGNEIMLYLVQVKIESLVFGNVVTNTWQQKQINKPITKQSQLIEILAHQ